MNGLQNLLEDAKKEYTKENAEYKDNIFKAVNEAGLIAVISEIISAGHKIQQDYDDNPKIQKAYQYVLSELDKIERKGLKMGLSGM